jgi:biotin synthase
MSPEQVLSACGSVAGAGIGTVILQSGDDLQYSREEICAILKKIKEKYPGIAVTLSLGERPFGDYRTFRSCGADRYLLKHETASPLLYRKLHPGQSFGRRMKILEHLRSLGFQVGVGNIVGIPGQTLGDLAEDILFMARFQPDMAGIGPFMPQKDTPLGGRPAGDILSTLKVLALTRIASPETHLPATTALASLDPENGHCSALRAGANVIMVNFTPDEFRTSYRIYDHKARVGFQEAIRAVEAAGRQASFGRGDSLKKSSQKSVASSQKK